MRLMKQDKTILKIREHIVIKNFWEYYVIEEEDINPSDDIQLCLVMGFENEIGYVSMADIKPFVITKTKNLDIMPASGWAWVE